MFLLQDCLHVKEAGLSEDLKAILKELTLLNRQEHSKVTLKARQVNWLHICFDDSWFQAIFQTWRHKKCDSLWFQRKGWSMLKDQGFTVDELSHAVGPFLCFAYKFYESIPYENSKPIFLLTMIYSFDYSTYLVAPLFSTHKPIP